MRSGERGRGRQRQNLPQQFSAARDSYSLFPFATHPVDKESRQSGFLMPSVARSSTKGTVVGTPTIGPSSRMMDATLGAEYFSLRGWSQRGEFRAMPTEHSYLDLNYFGVIDRGIGTPPLKEGGENVRLNSAGTIDGFRAVANIDYLSSFLFRLAFNEVFSQAVYSEVKSQAFLSKSADGISVEWISRALPELPEHDSGAGDHDFACPQALILRASTNAWGTLHFTGRLTHREQACHAASPTVFDLGPV